MERTSLQAALRRLIDTLVEGYTVLNHRLWVLIIPIGLDLLLWFGPRIAPQTLADALASRWLSMAQWAPSSLEQMGPEEVDQIAAIIRDWGVQTNLAHLFSAGLILLLLPKLAAPALPFAPAVWKPALGWVMFPLPLAAIVAGLLLWSFYLAPIADLVRESDENARAMLQRVAQTWWRLLQLLAGILLVGILLLLALFLLTALTTLLSPTLGMILVYLGFLAVLWLVIQLHLTPEAILFSGVSPTRAIFYSLQVTRSAPWQNLGLLLLILIIGNGTAMLLQWLTGHSLGVLAAILANAYITTGLAAARLIFYRDRLQRWLSLVQRALKERQRS